MIKLIMKKSDFFVGKYLKVGGGDIYNKMPFKKALLAKV